MPGRRYSEPAFSFIPLQEYAPHRSRNRLAILSMAFDSDLIPLESLWTPPASLYSPSDYDSEAPSWTPSSGCRNALRTPQRSRATTSASAISCSVVSFSAPSPGSWLRSLSLRSPTPSTRATTPSPGDINPDLMLRKLCDLEWWIEEATAGTDWDAHGERGLQSNGEFTAVDFAGSTMGIDDINDEAAETGIKEQTEDNLLDVVENGVENADTSRLVMGVRKRSNSLSLDGYTRSSVETVRRSTC